MGFSRGPWHVGLAVALAFVASTRAALAETPRACVEAVERGQSLRDKVKLTQAKAAFLVCASSTCPEVIQRDCAQWVSELDGRIPTVILTASDASGHDVVYARVSVDGELFADRLDGIAVPMDPGIHTFRIEPAGGPALQQIVVIREAEKYQKQHFTLPAASAPAVGAPSPPAPPHTGAPRSSPPPVEPPPARPSAAVAYPAGWRTGAIVAVSAAGVAAASFAAFGIGGIIDVQHLDSTCSTRCPYASVDTAKSYLRIADVSLGVGVVALAAATWFYLEWRAHPGRAPAIAGGDLVLRF